MKKCMQCGNENLDFANYCDGCGAALEGSMGAVQQGPSHVAGQSPAVEERRATRDSLRSMVTGVEFILEPGREYMIGRGDPARGLKTEICLDEPIALQQGVSRLHAKIVFEAGDFYIIDLNSTNATYINGQKIRPQQAYSLRNGDIIELGNYKLSFSRA